MAPFNPGESGNPKGRPKGSGDKRLNLRKLLDPHAHDLVEQAVKLALEGDTTALKLCLDRCVPPYKPQSAPVQFKPKGETLTDQARAIINAMAAGDVPADVAGTMLTALGSLARITEIDELERRIQALERDR